MFSFLKRIWGQNTSKTVEVMPEETMGFWRSLWQAFCIYLPVKSVGAESVPSAWAT